MNFYFVTAGNSDELEVIKTLKPPRLLASYHYFRTKGLKWLIEQIGYQPEIFLDSGAYSAFNSGKTILFENYLKFAKENRRFAKYIVCLDVVGNSQETFKNYLRLKNRGIDCIPVFHYLGDEADLERYIRRGEEYICLGGTVPIRNKAAVAEWVNSLISKYPEIKFHVLGSQAKKILDYCDIESADSATWIMMAMNGFPKHLGEKTRDGKKARMAWQMKKMMEDYK